MKTHETCEDFFLEKYDGSTAGVAIYRVYGGIDQSGLCSSSMWPC